MDPWPDAGPYSGFVSSCISCKGGPGVGGGEDKVEVQPVSLGLGGGSSLRGVCLLWPGVGGRMLCGHRDDPGVSAAHLSVCCRGPGPESALCPQSLPGRLWASFGLHSCCALHSHPAVAPAPGTVGGSAPGPQPVALDLWTVPSVPPHPGHVPCGCPRWAAQAECYLQRTKAKKALCFHGFTIYLCFLQRKS